MPAPEVTVYAKSRGCQPCEATKKHLTRLEIPFSIQYVDESESARDMVTLLGYTGVPVVVVGDMHWQGYRPSQIEQLFEIFAKVEDTIQYEDHALQYVREEDAA